MQGSLIFKKVFSLGFLNANRVNAAKKLCFFHKYSRLLRCSTARGSNTRFSLVGPNKVEAPESFAIPRQKPSK